MTYHGKVKNGVVVLDGDVVLSDGTVVRVEPVEERPLMDLARLAAEPGARTEWPADGAAEHDHYLYGTPKRGQ